MPSATWPAERGCGSSLRTASHTHEARGMNVTILRYCWGCSLMGTSPLHAAECEPEAVRFDGASPRLEPAVLPLAIRHTSAGRAPTAQPQRLHQHGDWLAFGLGCGWERQADRWVVIRDV